MQCWHFLSKLHIAPIGAPADRHSVTCNHGPSWVELLCAFELIGGVVDDPPPEDGTAIKLSLRASLACFWRLGRKVILRKCFREAPSPQL